MNESKTVFEQIEEQLGDGWGVALISTITPKEVRLQLIGKDEMYEGRYCVEAETLDLAIRAAIAFTNQTTPAQWESEFWRQMERGDEPDCRCPKCDKDLSFGDDDNYQTIENALSRFECSRCGTISTWDLNAPFPLLIKNGSWK